MGYTAVLETAAARIVGSTPTFGTNYVGLPEQQLEPAVTRLPSGFGGASPSFYTIYGVVAQSRERRTCNAEVKGLIPFFSTI
jgi:hypothetical protein